MNSTKNRKKDQHFLWVAQVPDFVREHFSMYKLGNDNYKLPSGNLKDKKWRL